MRIHLNLPSPSSPYTAGGSSSSWAGAPSPLTALTPNGELILIELQGSLEIENQSAGGGQVLGTISFEDQRPDRPVLMISHHRLEGKFVNLVKPLAVLEKKVRQDKVLQDSDRANAKRSAEEEEVRVVKKVRRERGESPPVEKKGRDALDFSSSPPRPTTSKTIVARGSELKDIDENHSEEIKQRGEGERKEEEEGDGAEEAEEHQTAVYYDVVSVIKRKILFSKRPEPIVRLDSTFSATTTKT